MSVWLAVVIFAVDGICVVAAISLGIYSTVHYRKGRL